MQFELLSNELLVDLFEYFNSNDLLRSFLELNSRLNQLIYFHFRSHQFELQSLSKDLFDRICDKHLPLLVDQLISVQLSDDETPTLTELLFSRGFTLDRFIHLKSLSLFNHYPFDILYKIICQCRYLSQLTHLNIINYVNNEEKYENTFDLFDQIWRWPTLRHCHLNGIKTTEISLRQISSCISSLSIENIPCSLHCLSHIIKSTPSLQRLCATVYSYSSDDRLTLIHSSIKSLKLFFGGIINSLNNLLENLPNLIHLNLATSQVYINGNSWEEMISQYLPQLIRFELKMEYEYHEDEIEDRIDELLLSFQSPFWLEVHHWYVRCHWNPSDPYKWLTVYTLPYAFDKFVYSNKYSTKSTSFHQQDYASYDHVNVFTHGRMLFDSSIDLHARFCHLNHLNLNLPFDDQFWLHFPSFLYLKSLQISLYKYTAYDQLQTLIHRAPHLYSLKIELCINRTTKLFQLTSSSIRRLDLIDLSLNQSVYHTNEDCLLLSHSSLGIQCEVLLIRVKHRTNIRNLLATMSNLRLLICECEDDEYSISDPHSSSQNALPPWLESHLPSTYSITRNRINPLHIQIWIDQTKILSNHQTTLSQIFTSFRRLFDRQITT